jgi:hypothetical protein
MVIGVTSISTLRPNVSKTLGELKIIRESVTGKLATWILLTLTIILSGCAAVNSDYLLLSADTCHKAGIPIDIYYEPPNFSYTKVAKIEATKNRLRDASWEDVKLAICRKAYELNMDIDGLMAIQSSEVSTNATLGPIGTGGEAEKLTAIAIRYDAR